ncbi:uncharacterized protein [Onthophagus taurus]|uniref:uncharacterized protein n=1 Tax=Onthophagus taurus TaxID=166361 RepID=UPI0039BEA9E1
MRFQFCVYFVIFGVIGFVNCLKNDDANVEIELPPASDIEESDLKEIDLTPELSLLENIESVPNTVEPQLVDLQPTDSPLLPNYEEADDMEYGGYFENRTVYTYNDSVLLHEEEESKEKSETKPQAEMKLSDPIQSNLKYNVEWIESADENTVDIDVVRSRPLNVVETWPWILTMTVVGTMFVLVLVGSMICYKLLTKRYNNREKLINEEDMIDPNDMKNFSL